MTKQLVLSIIVYGICFIIAAIVAELIIIAVGGTPVPAPTIPRASQVLGSGKKMTYVVMGDSTSISQGSDYEAGYALASARHLATKNYEVTFVNTGISGATAKTVADDQLAKAVSYKPDVVLIAVGANDTTHFTSGNSIKSSMQTIIDALKKANPAVKIVVTRSPAMDSVSRFPFISKWVMALRTKQVNDAFETVINENDLILAPIAEKTRAAFLKDSSLTAEDNFHPNARGYALWIPVINDTFDTVLPL
jgi:acyl-CoA thioesterase I